MKEKCIYLVGSTGFVGSNLKEQYSFDGLYHRENVEEAYDTNPDILVYSGVPAEKFLANKYPDKDMEIINGAIKNIQRINPKKLVLISTVDVYKNPINCNELSINDAEEQQAYGKDRLFLEEWVKNNFKDYLIIRLPALFGKNLKKNFVYDIINPIPSMLNSDKYLELNKDSILENYYEIQENGFYKCKVLDEETKNKLLMHFKKHGFTSLNFTDSRSSFQFYNLSNLWKDVNKFLKNNIKIINITSEPIKASELYRYLFGEQFVNELDRPIVSYDIKSIHDREFNGKNGYLYSREEVLKDLKEFVYNKLSTKKR